MQNVHDYLGKVHQPWTPRSGTGAKEAPGTDFLEMLLKQKLLEMTKSVIKSCFRISMNNWVRFRHLRVQGLGPDQGESEGMTFWHIVETKFVGDDETSQLNLFWYI